jgi:acyl CoA:acetate/3-ketoacid CoA transferase alpha subunit
MADKPSKLEAVLDLIEDGMTVGIGGWGSRRKPMALVRALRQSGRRDLTIVSYGGPDVGILADAGVASRVIAGFVTLDSIPLDPLWRRARQDGKVKLTELDEGLYYLGLQAAAWRVPFLPSRAGLGSVVLDQDAGLLTLSNPYDHSSWGDPDEIGGQYLAMPALRLDLAVCHANIADSSGNAALTGPDPFFDELFLGAAAIRVITTERLVDAGTLADHAPVSQICINRLMVDHVVETPGGAHFTDVRPEAGRDEAFQRHYAQAAKTAEGWAEFVERFLSGDEANYQAALTAWREEQ